MVDFSCVAPLLRSVGCLPGTSTGRRCFALFTQIATLFSLCLVLLAPLSAHADWEISYEDESSNTSTTPLDYSNIEGYAPNASPTMSASKDRTAILTWTGPGLPPTSVVVRELAECSAGGAIFTDPDWSWTGVTGISINTVENGFSDTQEAVWFSDYDNFRFAAGRHVQVIDNSAGDTEITLPTRHMEVSVSLGGSASQPTALYNYIKYSVEVIPLSFSFSGVDNDQVVSGTGAPVLNLYAQGEGLTSLVCEFDSEPVVLYPQWGDEFPTWLMERRVLAWDTTHFNDGDTVHIEAKAQFVIDGTPINFSDSRDVTIRNTALIYGNQTLAYGSQAALAANARLSSIDHTILASSTSTAKDDILYALPTGTVFYIWTHGLDSPSSFGDCFFDSALPLDTETLFANDYDEPTFSPSVGSAVSYKTSEQPPYNFAFLDCCLTAYNDEMASAFGIGWWSTNRAFLGYTTLTDDNEHNANWSNRVMQNLVDGMNIIDAVDVATGVGYPTNTYWDPFLMECVEDEAYTSIYGDWGTKIHGVYGGVYDTEWYRIDTP